MQLTPEQVNQFLAEAIIKSKIGDAVEACVAKVVKDLQSSYNNPFETAIKAEVSNIIVTVLREKYHDEIKTRVTAALAVKLTDDAIGELIDAAWKKSRRDY